MAFRSKLARQNQCCEQVMPAPVIPICAISCTPPTPICKIETPNIPPPIVVPPCPPCPCPCPEPTNYEDYNPYSAAQDAQDAKDAKAAQNFKLTQAIHELIASQKEIQNIIVKNNILPNNIQQNIPSDTPIYAKKNVNRHLKR